MTLLLFFHGEGATPPVANPVAAPVLARVYDGAALTGGVRHKPSSVVESTSASATSVALNLNTGGQHIETGDLLLVAIGWAHSSATVTPPAGWSTADSDGLAAGQGALYYKNAAAADETGTGIYTFTFSTAVAYKASGWVDSGLATSSVLDATSTATGTTTALSTGTTGATSQADEQRIACFFLFGTGSAAPTFDAGSGPTLSDITGSTVRLGIAHKILTATGTQAVTGTRPEAQSWVGIVATFKAAAAVSATPFALRGEFQGAVGQVRARWYEAGDWQITVSAEEALASEVANNDIVEFVVTEPTTDRWTLDWGIVRHRSRDESGPITMYTFAGPSLRVILDQTPAVVQFFSDQAGLGTPGSGEIENWMRRYVDAAVVDDYATEFPDEDTVFYLSVEAASGNRGTTYTSGPPGGQNDVLSETISTYYQRDNLGWWIALVDPGLSTATLEFQTRAGTDRSHGTASSVVFATQWYTATKLVYKDDAIDGVTSVIGIAPGGVTYDVRDSDGRTRWGVIRGAANNINEYTQGAAAAAIQLERRRAKEWVEVEALDQSWQRLGIDYALGDTVSVLSRDGTEFEQLVTEISMAIGPSDEGAGMAGLGGISITELLPGFVKERDQAWVYGIKPRAELVVGVPATPFRPGRDKRPVELITTA